MSDWLRHAGIMFVGLVIYGAFAEAVWAQSTPYNPYAESQGSLPPVAADGTLHWGPFYKSATLQKSYERLWNLGACRGTNKAITTPVERNTLVIDNLPESSFTGTVRATAGTIKGGLVAFSEGRAVDNAAPILVAQLHPAGVTQLQVGGPAAMTALKPGMTVRLRATVDEKGRASQPVSSIEIVSPPDGFSPDAVRPNVPDTIVGEIQRLNASVLLVRVATGKIRRLTLPLAVEPSIMIVDSSRIDLIAPGDSLEVTGRVWAGDGCMGVGTVFASRVVVNKASATNAEAAQPNPLSVSVR